MPKASLASPKPIHLPLEITQSKAKKANKIKPASKLFQFKIPASSADRRNKPAKAKTLKNPDKQIRDYLMAIIVNGDDN